MPFLLAAGRDLVADAFSGDLAFELDERQQNVRRQPPHGRGRVEALCYRYESNIIAVKDVDQFGEVGQRATKAVDLVEHDYVDQPVLDVGRQLLQPGSLERAAGKPPSSY